MSEKRSTACAACGRRGNRNCPALGGVICNACCGDRRGTEIDCPPECSRFPFGRAAYDRWLKVDDSWQRKALKYVIDKVGTTEFKISADHYAPSWLDGECAVLQGADTAFMKYLVMGKGDGTPSIGEMWKRENWPGLNNDERYMTEYRCRSMPGIIEVQKKLDDTAMECIDLLDTERGRFIVFDRSAVKNVARFGKIVVWITHYPHFTRLAGDGVKLPDNLAGPFLSEIRYRAKKELNSKSGEAVKRYLAENFVEAFELVAELGDKMRERMIASMDADRCLAFYKLLSPRAGIEAVLEEKPDFEKDADRQLEPDDPPDASYYSWLRRGEAKLIEKEIRGLIQHGNEDEDGVGTLGVVRLTGDELRIEIMGREKFKFARKLIRSYFKKRLKYVREEITPLEVLLEEHEVSGKEPAGPSDGIPPEIEKQLLEKFYEKHYSSFLDDPVPMIDDMTPREASRIPAMRPKLIELIKGHMNQIDKLCIEKGIDIDISWIVDELELDELK